MTAVTVRPARECHTDAIREIAEQGWRAAYGDILREGTIQTALAKWYDDEKTRAAITAEEITYYVATGEQVLGYLSGRTNKQTAHLGSIYVDPARWGEGIGSQLLDRFEQLAARQDCEAIRLEVLADNEVGRSFYRSRGYEAVDSREIDLFGETVAERILTQSIDS